MNTKMIKLEELRLDGDTQPRICIDQEVVADYAESMDAGKEFPPVEVYHDGAAYWLVDGFHRYHAALKLKRTEIAAVIKTGMQADARWASLGMNQGHGLRRTNGDKKNAVIRALKQKAELSDHAIAEHIGVSDRMVATYRTILVQSEKSATAKVSQSTLCKGRDGRIYKAGNIRHQAALRRGNPPSSKALFPVRKPIPEPMMAMSMPHNPVAGAKALMALFSREYCTSLVAELQALLAATVQK